MGCKKSGSHTFSRGCTYNEFKKKLYNWSVESFTIFQNIYRCQSLRQEKFFHISLHFISYPSCLFMAENLLRCVCSIYWSQWKKCSTLRAWENWLNHFVLSRHRMHSKKDRVTVTDTELPTNQARLCITSCTDRVDRYSAHASWKMTRRPRAMSSERYFQAWAVTVEKVIFTSHLSIYINLSCGNVFGRVLHEIKVMDQNKVCDV